MNCGCLPRAYEKTQTPALRTGVILVNDYETVNMNSDANIQTSRIMDIYGLFGRQHSNVPYYGHLRIIRMPTFKRSVLWTSTDYSDANTVNVDIIASCTALILST